MKPIKEIQQRTSKGYGIVYVIIFITVCVMLLGLFGCNTTKTANRKFYKALNINQTATANNCSLTFPPVAATKDSFIYIQGEDVVTHDTVQGNEYLVMGDTVIKYKYITKTVKITDTLKLTANTTIVDKAKEMALQNENTKLTVSNAKQKKALSISLWANGILGLLLIIWIVKKIWFK
jgi:hypothetical protein